MKKVLKLIAVIGVLMLTLSANVFALTDGDWEFQLLDNEVTITKYLGSGGNVVMPETIYGAPVTSMNAHAFNDAPAIVSVTFPSSMKIIPLQCFNSLVGNGKRALEEIILPEGVEEIGYQAFAGANKVKSIVLPSTLKVIDDQAFKDCTSLNIINFPDSLESIGKEAFKNTGLEILDLSDTKATISVSSFAECPNLTTVTLNNFVKTIPSAAFQNCEKLRDVAIPASVTSIGSGAFSGTAIEKIILPTSLTEIEKYGAFSNCKNLKEIVIPYGTKSIGGNTFEDCTNLEAVYIPDTVSSIGILNIVEGCPNAIIYCTADSYTAKHCKDKTISYLTDNSVNSGITVLYNGTRISFHAYGQNPELLNSRTLVPLRSIFEAMGAEVEWDGDTKTAVATRNGVTVKIQIGANEMYKGNEKIAVDVPATILNDRTMVPARVIAEAFGADVQWNDSGRTVLINE